MERNILLKKDIKLKEKVNEINSYFDINNKGKDIYLEEILVATLQKKTKNEIFDFFIGCYNKNIITTCKSILFILARNNKKVLLYEIIEAYYKRLTVSEKDVDKLLEYFIKIADYLLFCKYDLETSEKIYGLLANNDNSNDYKFLDCYKNYIPISFVIKTDRFEFMNSIVELSNSLDELDYDKIIKNSDYIFDTYNSINFSHYESNEIRIIFISILSIVNDVLFYHLYDYFIQNQDNVNNDVIKTNIINLMSINSGTLLNKYSAFVNENKDSDSVLKDIITIVKMVDHINHIKEALLDKKTSKIAYYASLESASYLLPYKNNNGMEGHLSLMNVSYMNDPSEGNVINKFLSLKKNSRIRENAKVPYVFIKSFTSSIDHLPMWEMYANKASGLCIVLNWEAMQKMNNRRLKLYRICYVDIDKKIILKSENNDLDVLLINEEMQQIKSILLNEKNVKLYYLLVESLETIAFLFKESHYYTEKELRIIDNEDHYNDNIISVSNSNGSEIDINNCPLLLKYTSYPVCIDEIVIGPKFKKTNYNLPFLQSQIELMCSKIGVEIPRITYSKIDYR